MDKMLVVVFDNESKAYEGARALKALHEEGSITLYAHSVIAKDVEGKVTVREESDRGPLGQAVGLLTGSLVGLVAGPVGLAVGGAIGIVGGSSYDVVNVGVGMNFLEQAEQTLTPGKAAVVAEIEEEWVTPLDSRMEALGGTVLRRARAEIIDEMMARDKAAMEAELAELKAEHVQANAQAKGRLETKMNAAKAQLQEMQARTRASLEARQRESEAKLASLKEQMARAKEERKQQIEKRKAEVEAQKKERDAKLSKAHELRDEASDLTKEALKP